MSEDDKRIFLKEEEAENLIKGGCLFQVIFAVGIALIVGGLTTEVIGTGVGLLVFGLLLVAYLYYLEKTYRLK